MHEMEHVIEEVSGMDAVSLQPRSGSQAIYANRRQKGALRVAGRRRCSRQTGRG